MPPSGRRAVRQPPRLAVEGDHGEASCKTSPMCATLSRNDRPGCGYLPLSGGGKFTWRLGTRPPPLPPARHVPGPGQRHAAEAALDVVAVEVGARARWEGVIGVGPAHRQDLGP